MRHRIPLAALVGLLLLPPAPARAFDYLEHTWFTDRACLEAQRRLAPQVRGGDPELVARYLALSLTCPERWERPYCLDGYKQLEGGLNRLEEPPAESGDHPATLGDFAALPDHLSQFGPVQGFPRAELPGLTETALGWLARTGDVGGVIADVAEDACESDAPVPWAQVEEDVSRILALAEAGPLPSPPAALLSPAARAELPQGPHDPAGAYSFDNPHYLDLVRRNGHHFGPRAWDAWLGFHGAGRTLAARPCEQILALDDDALEDLADGLPAFAEIDWDDLEPAELRRQGCAVIAERARGRLLEWAGRADPHLVEPVQAPLERLRAGGEGAAPLLDRIASALVGLVFEGSGLHFLQDAQAAGHLRVVPQSHDLAESRFNHDTDGRAGLSASLGARGGETLFVAFGDGRLLGPSLARVEGCDWSRTDLTREEVAACLLQRQRGLLVLTSTAALLDWARGGLLRADAPTASGEGCGDEAGPERFVCRNLPTRPPASGPAAAAAPRTLAEGTLPVPAPPFSYESLLVSSALDAAGGATQIGVRLVFLSPLGARADWMTSYHLGLMSTSATKAEPSQLSLEFSYMFHWRWAARFLVNAGPFVYGGLRGFGESVSTFTGVGPSAGISLLPEGWTKIPLEIGLTYRVPVTLLDSRHGFAAKGIRIEGHWIELAVGLAFM